MCKRVSGKYAFRIFTQTAPQSQETCLECWREYQMA
jgi:hypothetical protein